MAELAAPARSTRPSARTPAPPEPAAPTHTARDRGARNARGGAPPRWRRKLAKFRLGRERRIDFSFISCSVHHPLTRSQPRSATATDGNSRHGRSWLDWEGDIQTVEGMACWTWNSYAVERRWKSWLIGIAKKVLALIGYRRGGGTDSADLEGKSKSYAWNSEERGASCFCFATAH